jgi:hypothetical protein
MSAKPKRDPNRSPATRTDYWGLLSLLGGVFRTGAGPGPGRGHAHRPKPHPPARATRQDEALVGPGIESESAPQE